LVQPCKLLTVDIGWKSRGSTLLSVNFAKQPLHSLSYFQKMSRRFLERRPTPSTNPLLLFGAQSPRPSDRAARAHAGPIRPCHSHPPRCPDPEPHAGGWSPRPCHASLPRRVPLRIVDEAPHLEAVDHVAPPLLLVLDELLHVLMML
jgi:hypothetical protein